MFVSDEFVRSYETVAPLEAVLGVPVRRYQARSPLSADISVAVGSMIPCPENAIVCSVEGRVGVSGWDACGGVVWRWRW